MNPTTSPARSGLPFVTTDLADLAQMLAPYGTTSGAVYEDGDLDGDDDVDLSDLAELLSAYGESCE